MWLSVSGYSFHVKGRLELNLAKFVPSCSHSEEVIYPKIQVSCTISYTLDLIMLQLKAFAKHCMSFYHTFDIEIFNLAAKQLTSEQKRVTETFSYSTPSWTFHSFKYGIYLKQPFHQRIRTNEPKKLSDMLLREIFSSLMHT